MTPRQVVTMVTCWAVAPAVIAAAIALPVGTALEPVGRHRGFYRQLNMLPRLHRLESTAALKGERPGDNAGVRGSACGGCGHVHRLIT
jgi:hypothetical protein